MDIRRRARPSRMVLAVLAAILLGAPAASQAADTTTVSVSTGAFTVRTTDSAAAGSQISVAQNAAGDVLVREIGADIVLVAEPPCSLLSTTEARCPRDPANGARLRIFAGQGTDAVDLRELPIGKASSIEVREVYGGSGNDSLVGTAGDDLLDGDGPKGSGVAPAAGEPVISGNDALFGGGGADVLRGQRGNDYLNGDGDGVAGDAGNTLDGGPGADFLDAGASTGPDVLTGGAGDDLPGVFRRSLPNPGLLPNGTVVDLEGGDTVSYATRTFTTTGTAGVIADIDGVADDGAAAEGDRISTDVESLVGSFRDDALTGSNAANYVTGGRGRDKLIGQGGSDRLDLRDGTADPCYTSTNLTTLLLDLVDPALESCPRILYLTLVQTPIDEKRPAVEFGAVVRASGAGGLRVALVCPVAARSACAGRLAVATRSGARALGSRTFRVPAGRKRTAVVQLGRSGLRTLRRTGRVTLSATFTGTSKKGRTTSTAERRLR